MSESEADHAAVQTGSSSPNAIAQALSLIVQQTPNAPYGAKALLDPATSICTFARLLCVSKKLQDALDSAAVGWLSVDLTLSMNEDPARSTDGPEIPVPISENHLNWARHLQRGHIRQLRLSGMSARSMQRLPASSALLPLLERLWTDIRSQHHACIHPRSAAAGGWGFYTSCGVLVDVNPGNPTDAQPQLSHTITQLTLGFEGEGMFSPKHDWQPALRRLPRLTSLLELQLPLFNPPAGTLAPALSALTSLTKLFIRHPLPPEQEALPVSLKHLSVARMFESSHGTFPGFLPALHLSHLTALDTLVIYEEHWARRYTGIFANSHMMFAGVPDGSALPITLLHLAVKAVPYVEPLLTLTRLETLTLTHGIHDRWYRPNVKFSAVEGLSALTQLPSLSRLIIKGKPPTQQQLDQDGLQAVLDALPVDMSVLDPVSLTPSSSPAPNSGRITAFQTGLNGVVVRGSRGCSLWTGVQVLVAMLTGRNS